MKITGLVLSVCVGVATAGIDKRTIDHTHVDRPKPLPINHGHALSWFEEKAHGLLSMFTPSVHEHSKDHHFVPHNHGTARKVPGGEHHKAGPLIPGEAVDHARKYGHFNSEQLDEIEEELQKYAKSHHDEIEAMRSFRKTLPIDPHMWNEMDRKRFDTRYNAKVQKVKALAKGSRDVARKWKIPPKNIGKRDTTYVLDEKHLSMISEHLWFLSQKGEWTDEQRAHFRQDLDKYVELEQKVLEHKATAPPTAKGDKKLATTQDMKDARQLRAMLENAVHVYRTEL